MISTTSVQATETNSRLIFKHWLGLTIRQLSSNRACVAGGIRAGERAGSNVLAAKPREEWGVSLKNRLRENFNLLLEVVRSQMANIGESVLKALNFLNILCPEERAGDGCEGVTLWE